MTVQLRNVLTGLGLVGAIALTQGASAATDAATKRAELRKMCDEALATLFKEKPAVKASIAKSAGYGCFTSHGMSFFIGGARGQRPRAFECHQEGHLHEHGAGQRRPGLRHQGLP